MSELKLLENILITNQFILASIVLVIIAYVIRHLD